MIEKTPVNETTITVNNVLTEFFTGLPRLIELEAGYKQISGVPGEPHIFRSDRVAVQILDANRTLREEVMLEKLNVLICHGKYGIDYQGATSPEERMLMFTSKDRKLEWQFGSGVSVIGFVNEFNKIFPDNRIQVLYVCDGYLNPGQAFKEPLIFATGSEVTGGVTVDPQGMIATIIRMVNPDLGEWHGLPGN